MLKPAKRTKNETNTILRNISTYAQIVNSEYLNTDVINEKINATSNIEERKRLMKIKKNYLKILNFLNKSDICQYDLPELQNGKIYLSEEVFKKLQSYAKKTNSKDHEFGCYLFGKEIKNNTILFDDFNKAQPQIFTTEFNTSEEMEEEIIEKIDSKKIDCVCHVHTHPYRRGRVYSSTPSNYDLFTYAWFQEQHYNPNNRISFMGALITPPEPGKSTYNDICFIFYDRNTKSFYKITNIWHFSKNKEPIKLENKQYDNDTKKVVLLYQKNDIKTGN